MNCREAQQYIFAERESALEKSQRAALAAHVTECAACRRASEQLAAMFESWRTDAAAVHVPDPELEWHNVRRQIRNEAPVRRMSPLTWIAVPLAAAAALAIGIYVAPQAHHAAAPTESIATVAKSTPSPGAAVTEAPSTVVFVDDKSGWTFVVASDTPERRI